MKITDTLFPGRAAPQPKQSFSALVVQHKPMQQQLPLHRKPLMPPPLPAQKLVPPGVKPLTHLAIANQSAVRSAQQVFTSHQQTAATLTTARAASQLSATQLVQNRLMGQAVASEKLDGRLVDLICKELVTEFTTDPSRSRVANQDLPLAPPIAGLTPVQSSAVPSPRPVDGSVKAAQAVELIERIETFIKDSRRPSLALTLNNSLGAKVEIERIGPREVALKIVGHKGPPQAEDISRIRDEMQAHGLKVCALSVS